jgi:uncharacterized protein
VKEVKSAKHIKREHVLQTAFYNYVLGKVQGFTPETFYVINRDKKEFEFVYQKYHDELMAVLSEIRAIFSGKPVTPTAKAARWPWERYALKRAIETDDVSLVPQVGTEIKAKLNAAGITTVKQLAAAEVSIPSITPGVLKKIQTAAQAWYEKKQIVLQKPTLPPGPEIFIDFEGTDELETEEGMLRVDYLIGVLDEGKFVFFFAENLEQEERLFRSFVEYLKTKQDTTIYHYGPYERNHLSTLGEKYRVDVSPYLERMVDLLAMTKRAVVLPTLSYSLKDVGKFLGASWRGTSDAQESMVLYLQYLETKDQTLLQQLLNYNEDDVRATKAVKDFLGEITVK